MHMEVIQRAESMARRNAAINGGINYIIEQEQNEKDKDSNDGYIVEEIPRKLKNHKMATVKSKMKTKFQKNKLWNLHDLWKTQPMSQMKIESTEESTQDPQPETTE